MNPIKAILFAALLTVGIHTTANAYDWPITCMDGAPAPFPAVNTFTCSWQPLSDFNALPPRVTRCDFSPLSPATMQIYSEENFQGHCARVYGNADFIGYPFNTDFVALYGWWSNDTWDFVPYRIKSVRIGTNTKLMMCQGSLTNGAYCSGRQLGLQTGLYGQEAGWSAFQNAGDPIFNVYSFILGKTQ